MRARRRFSMMGLEDLNEKKIKDKKIKQKARGPSSYHSAEGVNIFRYYCLKSLPSCSPTRSEVSPGWSPRPEQPRTETFVPRSRRASSGSKPSARHEKKRPLLSDRTVRDRPVIHVSARIYWSAAARDPLVWHVPGFPAAGQ